MSSGGCALPRALFHQLDLDGCKVSPDARHTQTQTARELMLEHSANLLLTVKDNQPTLRTHSKHLLPPRRRMFPLARPPRRWPASVSSTKAGPNGAACFPAPALPGNRNACHQPVAQRLDGRPVVGV